MTKVYFIKGKKIDLDSSEWLLIYSDGRWQSRGVNLYFRRKEEYNWFILEVWSNWQGEHNKIEILSEQEAIEFLTDTPHPNRANEALQMAGLKVEEY